MVVVLAAVKWKVLVVIVVMVVKLGVVVVEIVGMLYLLVETGLSEEKVAASFV